MKSFVRVVAVPLTVSAAVLGILFLFLGQLGNFWCLIGTLLGVVVNYAILWRNLESEVRKPYISDPEGLNWISSVLAPGSVVLFGGLLGIL